MVMVIAITTLNANTDSDDLEFLETEYRSNLGNGFCRRG